jgi:hypothetical protein
VCAAVEAQHLASWPQQQPLSAAEAVPPRNPKDISATASSVYLSMTPSPVDVDDDRD